jgi:hypothetical protein
MKVIIIIEIKLINVIHDIIHDNWIFVIFGGYFCIYLKALDMKWFLNCCTHLPSKNRPIIT